MTGSLRDLHAVDEEFHRVRLVAGVHHHHERADERQGGPMLAVGPVLLRRVPGAPRTADLDVVLPVVHVLLPVHLDREPVVRVGRNGVEVEKPRDDLDGVQLGAGDLRRVGAREARDGQFAFHARSVPGH